MKAARVARFVTGWCIAPLVLVVEGWAAFGWYLLGGLSLTIYSASKAFIEECEDAR